MSKFNIGFGYPCSDTCNLCEKQEVDLKKAQIAGDEKNCKKSLSKKLNFIIKKQMFLQSKFKKQLKMPNYVTIVSVSVCFISALPQ